jgi:hypothetical protein
VFYTNRVLFLHPVRCGGTWLTEWARLNLYASGDVHHLKHATRDELAARIPQLATLEAFTIVRDDEERFESFCRVTRNFNLARRPIDWTPEWERIALDFHELPSEEFRRRYFRPTSDYLTPGVRAFSYSPDLEEVTTWLASNAGAPSSPASLSPVGALLPS